MYLVSPFITPKDPTVAQIALIVSTYANKYYYLTVTNTATRKVLIEILVHIPSEFLYSQLNDELRSIHHRLPEISSARLYRCQPNQLGRDIAHAHGCKHTPTILLPQLQK